MKTFLIAFVRVIVVCFSKFCNLIRHYQKQLYDNQNSVFINCLTEYDLPARFITKQALNMIHEGNPTSVIKWRRKMLFVICDLSMVVDTETSDIRELFCQLRERYRFSHCILLVPKLPTNYEQGEPDSKQGLNTIFSCQKQIIWHHIKQRFVLLWQQVFISIPILVIEHSPLANYQAHEAIPLAPALESMINRIKNHIINQKKRYLYRMTTMFGITLSMLVLILANVHSYSITRHDSSLIAQLRVSTKDNHRQLNDQVADLIRIKHHHRWFHRLSSSLLFESYQNAHALKRLEIDYIARLRQEIIKSLSDSKHKKRFILLLSNLMRLAENALDDQIIGKANYRITIPAIFFHQTAIRIEKILHKANFGSLASHSFEMLKSRYDQLRNQFFQHHKETLFKHIHFHLDKLDSGNRLNQFLLTALKSYSELISAQLGKLKQKISISESTHEKMLQIHDWNITTTSKASFKQLLNNIQTLESDPKASEEESSEIEQQFIRDFESTLLAGLKLNLWQHLDSIWQASAYHVLHQLTQGESSVLLKSINLPDLNAIFGGSESAGRQLAEELTELKQSAPNLYNSCRREVTDKIILLYQFYQALTTNNKTLLIEPSHLDANSANATLLLDKALFSYQHGPTYTYQTVWPKALSQIQIQNFSEGSAMMTSQGIWSFSTLIKRAKQHWLNNKQLRLVFSIDHHVFQLLVSTVPLNLLKLDPYSRLMLPKQICSKEEKI